MTDRMERGWWGRLWRGVDQKEMVWVVVSNTLLVTNVSFQKGTFEDDFPFLQVGYVSSLEGFFCYHPYFWKISNLTHIFQRGWFNHQLVVNKLLGRFSLEGIGVSFLKLMCFQFVEL